MNEHGVHGRSLSFEDEGRGAWNVGMSAVAGGDGNKKLAERDSGLRPKWVEGGFGRRKAAAPVSGGLSRPGGRIGFRISGE